MHLLLLHVRLYMYKQNVNKEEHRRFKKYSSVYMYTVAGVHRHVPDL